MRSPYKETIGSTLDIVSKYCSQLRPLPVPFLLGLGVEVSGLDSERVYHGYVKTLIRGAWFLF